MRNLNDRSRLISSPAFREQSLINSVEALRLTPSKGGEGVALCWQCHAHSLLDRGQGSNDRCPVKGLQYTNNF